MIRAFVVYLTVTIKPQGCGYRQSLLRVLDLFFESGCWKRAPRAAGRRFAAGFNGQKTGLDRYCRPHAIGDFAVCPAGLASDVNAPEACLAAAKSSAERWFLSCFDAPGSAFLSNSKLQRNVTTCPKRTAESGKTRFRSVAEDSGVNSKQFPVGRLNEAVDRTRALRSPPVAISL